MPHTLTAALGALCLLASPLAAQTETSAAAPAGTPIVTGTSHTVASASLNADRTINIYLPPGHDEAETPYTVLYLIDGGTEQDFLHIAGLAQLGAISWQYEPVIIVGIETENRLLELAPAPQDARYVEHFPPSGEAAAFRAYIAEEVIPFVEATYRTGERRALMGESLAGLFVLDTMMAAPDLFDDYVAVAPSLWWDDRALAAGAPESLAAEGHSANRLYLTMADEGGTMQLGLDELIAALEASETGPDWTYIDRRGSETHASIFHPSALDALRWLYPREALEYGEAPWYLVEGGEPPVDGE